jgi:hypothetical protein
MSLGICVKGPEGLVLAAESRVTLFQRAPSGVVIQVNFDNATKLLSFHDPNTSVGVVTYGQSIVGRTGRTASSFLPEFEASLPKERLKIDQFARSLHDFYLKQWQDNIIPEYQGPNMVFVVGGYNDDEHFGRVYVIELPLNPTMIEQYSGSHQFGFTWGGQREIVDRIMSGYDGRFLDIVKNKLGLSEDQVRDLGQELRQLQLHVPIEILPLQDCVDLAIFFIRATIEAQKLTVDIRGAGGPIEVATITRNDGLRYIQRKVILGEGGRNYGPADDENGSFWKN